MNRTRSWLRTVFVDRTLRANWPSWLMLGAATVIVLAARHVAQDLIAHGADLRLDEPPLHAALDWRPNWRLVLPVGIGAVATAAAPALARRMAWSVLLVGLAALSAAWAVALALLDGVNGLVGSVARNTEYFPDVGKVGSPGSFLHGFVTHINDYNLHVTGHPPGFLLFLWGVDRLGFGTVGVVAALEIAAGALAVPAVLIAVREVAGEASARAAAPFVAVSPLAIWVATSADAFFMGVSAWAVALVILATGRTGRRAVVYASGGGLLFGFAAFLSYGLVLLAAVPFAVAWSRRRFGALVVAGCGAAAVFAAAALAGFWWFDGLAATHDIYYAGVASRRPYLEFLLVNAACLLIVLGPAVVVALGRLRDRRTWLLVGGALATIGLAALSGMSKGEVERIWLPFFIWVLPAAAVLGIGRRRAPWLAAQVAYTIVLQTLIRSPW
jgi:hypothetical protein